MPITFEDKLLPIQPAFAHLFDGTSQSLISAIYESGSRFSGLNHPGDDFVLERSTKFTIEELASTPLALRFMEMLVLIRQPRRVLEIGTFIGLATMYIARALPEGGKITTIEKFDEFAGIASRNFEKNGLKARVDLIQGDAMTVIEGLKESFDLIFLDGNKENYDQYFNALNPRLATGGLLIIDDVFFHGDVLNAVPKTEKGQGVRRFLENASVAHGYSKVILPIANGIMLMLKTN